MREDYSHDGSARDSSPHDHARNRAYRWGEDGIAGFSDDRQLLCFSLALWNGQDPILKERLFGLTNREGNHGEDVKELYHDLDAAPTHSYLAMSYRYPQREYPHRALVDGNLYVADGSFFCSSGALNPSLTIVANALHAGDHLAERLA